MRVEATLWRTPSKRLSLSDDEVHVWRVSVSAAKPQKEASLNIARKQAEKHGIKNVTFRKQNILLLDSKGGGVSIDLDGFDVSMTPGEPAKLLRSAEDPEATLRWSLMEIISAPGYAGAVAVEGRDWGLRYWDWEKQE